MSLGTITRRLTDTKEDMFRALLSRRDFEARAERLKHASRSERHTVCASLCEMFDAVGISCERGREDAYYDELIRSSGLPEPDDIVSEIIRILFEKYSDYPTPSQYMERIVDRLADPEDGWGDDPLRLRILKQFVKYGSCLVYRDENGKSVSICGWEKVITAYAQRNGAPKRAELCTLADFIDDGIFKEYHDAMSEYQEVLHRCQSSESLNVLRERIRDLKMRKRSLKGSGNAEERSAVDRELAEAEAARKEEEKLIDRAKAKLKYARESYGLVRLADDLAEGRFRAGGATRTDLYLFAIVFDMTYYCPSGDGSGMILSYDSDIEKNLFEDYYTNNFMRFITDPYSENLSALELDPPGQGINYKNFAEMVYLYYISKDLEPVEKLRLAHSMIERLKGSTVTREISGTERYRSFFTDELLSLPEPEFERFIRENYDLDVTYGDSRKRGVMQVQTSRNTAFGVYGELIEAMTNLEVPLSPENCNYGLWFTDVSVFSKLKSGAMRELTGADDDKLEGFIGLLRGINRFLGIEVDEQVSSLNGNQEHTDSSRRMIRAMSITDPEKMTRTSLIVAYYYYYNEHTMNLGAVKNLCDVYKDYTNDIIGLNALLREAHFQPLSDKSIFDLVVILSSYAYLNY